MLLFAVLLVRIIARAKYYEWCRRRLSGAAQKVETEGGIWKGYSKAKAFVCLPHSMTKRLLYYDQHAFIVRLWSTPEKHQKVHKLLDKQFSRVGRVHIKDPFLHLPLSKHSVSVDSVLIWSHL